MSISLPLSLSLSLSLILSLPPPTPTSPLFLSLSLDRVPWELVWGVFTSFCCWSKFVDGETRTKDIWVSWELAPMVLEQLCRWHFVTVHTNMADHQLGQLGRVFPSNNFIVDIEKANWPFRMWRFTVSLMAPERPQFTGNKQTPADSWILTPANKSPTNAV